MNEMSEIKDNKNKGIDEKPTIEQRENNEIRVLFICLFLAGVLVVFGFRQLDDIDNYFVTNIAHSPYLDSNEVSELALFTVLFIVFGKIVLIGFGVVIVGKIGLAIIRAILDSWNQPKKAKA